MDREHLTDLAAESISSMIVAAILSAREIGTAIIPVIAASALLTWALPIASISFIESIALVVAIKIAISPIVKIEPPLTQQEIEALARSEPGLRVVRDE